MHSAARRVFLAGIGGIGVSALAQWLAAEGWRVEGADHTSSEITDLLQARGILVSIAEQPVLPADTDLVVYSDAVPPAHPIRQAAAARALRTVSYAELLGECTAGRTTVAVSGSHGKSTTTALVGLLLEAVGRDPGVVVGTRVPQWGRHGVGNFRPGKGMVVVEADEYRGHFLTVRPTVAVITSVDHDHVDAFPTPAEYEDAFHSFIRLVPEGGRVVLRADDPAAARLRAAVGAGRTTLTFGAGVAADVAATGIVVRDRQQEFTLTVQGASWGQYGLRVPGAHMIADAAAAIAAALPFGLTPDTARQTLADFRGTWRRFELVGTVNGAPLISDYAHHPTELKALHDAARQWYPGRRLVIAFQPHQHSRTRAFADQFVDVLRAFDAVVLAEVYDVAGREDQDLVTTADWVAPLRAAGRAVTYARTLEEVSATLRAHARPEDIVLVVGAGDIDTVARRIAAP